MGAVAIDSTLLCEGEVGHVVVAGPHVTDTVQYLVVGSWLLVSKLVGGEADNVEYAIKFGL